MPETRHLSFGGRLRDRLRPWAYISELHFESSAPKDLYRQMVQLGSLAGYQGNFARVVQQTIAVLIDDPSEICHSPQAVFLGTTTANVRDVDEPFLRKAIELESAGLTDAALDVVYSEVDVLMRSGQFSKLNSLVSSIDPECLSTDLLLAVLTATLPAKSRLPARRGFFEKVESALKSRGEFEPGLLTGL